MAPQFVIWAFKWAILIFFKRSNNCLRQHVTNLTLGDDFEHQVTLPPERIFPTRQCPKPPHKRAAAIYLSNLNQYLPVNIDAICQA
jgi:hypothetical protein